MGERKRTHYFDFYNTDICTRADIAISNILRNARIMGNKSQKDVSLLLGISQQMVSYIERGNYRGIKYYRYMPRLYKYLEACGCVLRFDILVLSDSDDDNISDKPKQRIRKPKVLNSDSNILP